MYLELLSKVDVVLGEVDVPERHTYFQLKNFIVGKECTVQSQMWQIIRELRARRESLEAMEEQIADTEDNIELAEVRVDRLNRKYATTPEASRDSHWEKESQIRIRRATRDKKSLERTAERLKKKAKYLSEEVTYLLGAYEVLSKVEPIKSLDDIESQRNYWNEKFLEELNLRLLLKQPLDSDFVRSIMALDDDVPVKSQMTKILNGIQDQIVAERHRQKQAQLKIDELEAIQKQAKEIGDH